MNEVFKKKVDDVRFQEIEQLIASEKNNRQMIAFDDLGALSKKNKQKQKSIGQIVSHSTISPFKARVMYHLVKHFQCKKVLELGGNCGFSAAFMAIAFNNEVMSVEGIDALCKIASTNHSKLKINNIEVIHNRFNPFIHALNKDDLFDLIFIDGDHRYESCVSLCKQLLPHLSENGIMVLDDIYWSAGMKQAWEEIYQSTAIKLSIDVFHLGLLFPNSKRSEKEHFRLVNV